MSHLCLKSSYGNFVHNNTISSAVMRNNIILCTSIFLSSLLFLALTMKNSGSAVSVVKNRTLHVHTS